MAGKMDDEDDSFVTIGTPFEVPDEEESRKKPLSVQEQIAVDSKGRRRFHGAFTGGFSAGYFNSVGSKEGWTPSSFVSSREHRAESTNTKPEDFMDDEDMSEFGIAPKRVMAKQDFTPVEQETDSRKRKLEQDVRDGVLHTAIPGGVPVEDLIIPARLSIGVRLLRKMGWKEGQGVGTKEKKKIVVAKGDYMSMTDTTKDRKVYGCALPEISSDDKDKNEELDIYSLGVFLAPKDVQPITFTPKDNYHGIGYSGINPSTALFAGASSLEEAFRPTGNDRRGIRGQAFGVGAFEEEDDDIYSNKDMSDYDFATGLCASDDSKDRHGWSGPPKTDNVKGCLLGFKKAKHRRALNKVFPPPPLPPTFKPVHKFKTNDIIIRLDSKRSTLTSKDRAVLLGEQKPENTIKLAFDLMSEEDKKRIQCTKRKEQDTGAEKIRKGERKATRWDSTTHTKSTSIAFVPTAVEFSQESFKPFLKDPAKQKRYEIYLAVKKSGKEPDLSNDRSMTEWEKDREKEEFSRAAILYRPLSSAIASRFIRATEDHLSTENEPRCDSKVAECKISKEDCDRRKAASLGMFGRLTRITYEWHPSKLLCKRFNIPNPFPGSRVLGVPGRSKQKTNTSFPGVVPDPYLEDEKKSDMSTETFESMKSLEREDKDSSSEEEDENIIRLPVNRNVKGKITIGPLSHLNKLLGKDAENDRNKDNNVEKEGVLNEPQKPSMDLFKAIFEDSDDESENEDDKEALGNNQKEALKIGVKDDSVLMTETCNNSDRALDITEIVYLTSDVMSDRKEPSADLSDLEVKNSVSLSRNKHGPLPESKTTKLRTTEQGKAPFQFIEKSRVNHAQSKYKAEHVTEPVSKTTENIHRTNHTYGPSLPVQQPSADLMRNALSSNERLTSGLSERHNVTKFDLSRDKSHEISHHHHPKSKKEKKKKTKSKHKHKQKQKDSHKKKRKKQKTEKHSKNYSSDTDSTDSDEYDSSSMKKLKTLRKESSSDSDTNNDTIVPSSKLLLEKLKKYGKGIRRPSAADFM